MSDATEKAETPEFCGTMETPDGQVVGVVARFCIFRDEREVLICLGEDGKIGLRTQSWLRENDRKLVETTHRYTLDSFLLMLETMTLAADYFGIDLKAHCERLHASDGEVRFEYAGRGEPSFVKTQLAEESQ